MNTCVQLIFNKKMKYCRIKNNVTKKQYSKKEQKKEQNITLVTCLLPSPFSSLHGGQKK